MILNNKSKKNQVVSMRGHHFHTKYINKDSNVVDLGSHLGQFSKQVSNQFGCKCFAVEAFPELFKQILETPLIQKFNYAISDKNAPINFTICDNLEANHISEYSSDTENNITVPGITFENFILKHNIQDIDLLKVDIEGAEINLFNSMNDKTLKRIRQISIEFHDFVFPIEKDVNKIINRLEKLGFYPINFSLRTKEDFLFINYKLCDFSFADFLFMKYVFKNIEGLKRIFKRMKRNIHAVD